jgi:hypothetical protein
MLAAGRHDRRNALEERLRDAGKGPVKREAPTSFVSAARYDASHPRALAVYCSDGRFTQAIEDLLRHLGHDRLDTLTLPGGPGLLNLWAGSLLEADQMERAARFLIRGPSSTSCCSRTRGVAITGSASPAAPRARRS